jgi:hypothetical protein
VSTRTKTHEATAPPLPHNLEAERAVLGTVLLDNSSLPVALGVVSVHDFYLRQNRLIFSAMFDLVDQGVPIDTVTLIEHLSRNDNLESAGGVPYVSGLPDGLPRVTNVGHYARIVKEKATLRSLIHTAAEIQAMAFKGDDPVAVLDQANRTFGELRAVQSGPSVSLFDSAEEFRTARPLRALIQNFLHADVCNIIGGLSGDGKTLVLFSVTKALLTGKPLFGYFKVIEPLERVIYLIPECARSPFYHRAKLFGLEQYIESGRLLVRTLSKGPKIDLDDYRLLHVVKDAAIMIDTAARFGTGNENEASDVASGLAANIFGLLAAGAAAVSCAHHSPKNFEKDSFIVLENVLRGSGDFGAFIGAGFGIRQIDALENIIHLEDIKARDASPFPPFQIIGRPYIDSEGDFRMHRHPGDCEKLAEYLDTSARNKGGAPIQAREAKAANLALVSTWLKEDRNLTSTQLSARFESIGIEVRPETIRGYKRNISK